MKQKQFDEKIESLIYARISKSIRPDAGRSDKVPTTKKTAQHAQNKR